MPGCWEKVGAGFCLLADFIPTGPGRLLFSIVVSILQMRKQRPREGKT